MQRNNYIEADSVPQKILQHLFTQVKVKSSHSRNYSSKEILGKKATHVLITDENINHLISKKLHHQTDQNVKLKLKFWYFKDENESNSYKHNYRKQN